MQFIDVPSALNNGAISLLGEIFLIVVIVGGLLHLMNRRSRSFREIDLSKVKLSPTHISLLLLLIAILSPAYLNIFPGDISGFSIGMFSMSWQIAVSNTLFILFGPDFLVLSLILMCMKIVFVYQVFKFYYGETTKTRVIIAGIFGEIQLLLIGLATLPFILATPNVGVAFPIPLPILLLTGLLALKFLPPPPVQGDWKDLEKPEEWWEKQD